MVVKINFTKNKILIFFENRFHEKMKILFFGGGGGALYCSDDFDVLGESYF